VELKKNYFVNKDLSLETGKKKSLTPDSTVHWTTIQTATLPSPTNILWIYCIIIYDLFNNAVSSSHYTAMNDRIFYEMGIIWKEAVIANLK
jgi:hypothetical protein